MIFLFGTKRCKHCNSQKIHLNNTFGPDHWLYIDILKSDESLKVASEINLDHVPAIIIFDDQSKEIFRTEGTCAPDKLFSKIYENALPCKKSDKVGIFSGQRDSVLLSFNPEFESGQEVKILTYTGEEVSNVKIASCVKHSINGLTDFERGQYLANGGRRDFAWRIKFWKA
jgi:hypothetical protein